MDEKSPPPERTPDTALLASARKSDALLKTYQYLRISVTALPLVIVVSILVATRNDEPHWSSISYYFYSPVRSIFVGALFGVCVGLIAIKGRDRLGEDVALNLAGIFAPIVAVVPTLEKTRTAHCPGKEQTCISASTLPFITNNVETMLVLGVAGVVTAWLLALVKRQLSRANRHLLGNVIGLVLASSLVVAMWIWYAHDEHTSFVNNAHYVAAAGLFVCVTYVAIVNAIAVGNRVPPFLPRKVYLWSYIVVAAAMLAALSVATIGAWQSRTGHGEIFPRWLFWCEVVLLGFFTLFWALQTLDFWREGVPDEDGERARAHARERARAEARAA